MTGLFNYQIPKKIKGKYTDAQKWNYYKSKTEPKLYDQLYTASIPEDESSLLKTVREIKELFQEFKTKNKTITHKSSDVGYDAADIHSIDEVGLPTEVKYDRMMSDLENDPETQRMLEDFEEDSEIQPERLIDAETTTDGGRGRGRPRQETVKIPRLYTGSQTPENYKEPKGTSIQTNYSTPIKYPPSRYDFLADNKYLKTSHLPKKSPLANKVASRIGMNKFRNLIGESKK